MRHRFRSTINSIIQGFKVEADKVPKEINDYLMYKAFAEELRMSPSEVDALPERDFAIYSIILDETGRAREILNAKRNATFNSN